MSLFFYGEPTSCPSIPPRLYEPLRGSCLNEGQDVQLPKNKDMKTQEFKFDLQENAHKRLFQLLFETQTELINYHKNVSGYEQESRLEIELLINSIDSLMERMTAET